MNRIYSLGAIRQLQCTDFRAAAIVLMLSTFIGPVQADDIGYPTMAQSSRRDQLRKATLDRIQAEGADRVTFYRDAAQSESSRLGYAANKQLNALMREHDRQIGEMRKARTYQYDSSGHKASVPAYSEEDLENAEEEMLNEETSLKNRTAATLNSLSQSAEQKAAVLQTEAANLKSQLSQTSAASNINLTPVGTNLYVRNYVLGGKRNENDGFAPTPRVQGLHARAASLSSHTVAPVSTTQ